MSRAMMKRRLAAALCAAVLCTCAAPASGRAGVALAEGTFSAAAFSLAVETTQAGVRVSISGADSLPMTVGVYNSQGGADGQRKRRAAASLLGKLLCQGAL